jgi:Terminase RNaseH-like domain
MDMLDRMQSGRFKVFKHLNDWFDEFRLYHRKDGRVHKEGDDLMSATRYAIMNAALRAHGCSTQATVDQIGPQLDGGVTLHITPFDATRFPWWFVVWRKLWRMKDAC